MINGLTTITKRRARFGVIPEPCIPGDDNCDTGGGGGGGGGLVPPPTWLIGTFYSLGHILTINSNGTALVTTIGGGTASGIMDSNILYPLGAVGGAAYSVITPTSSGIKATGHNGATEIYYRNQGDIGVVYTDIPVDDGGVDHVNPADCDSTVSNCTACTADAKTCPDGSSVGRNPNNNCQFFACPTGNPITDFIDSIFGDVGNSAPLVWAKDNPLIVAGVVIGGIFLLTRRS